MQKGLGPSRSQIRCPGGQAQMPPSQIRPPPQSASRQQSPAGMLTPSHSVPLWQGHRPFRQVWSPGQSVSIASEVGRGVVVLSSSPGSGYGDGCGAGRA